MLNVRSSITFQLVLVLQEWLETLSHVAQSNRKNPKHHKVHVNHHLADQIRNVEITTVKQFVLASLNTSEVHPIAAQSVYSARNVLKTELASIKSVLIHALEHVDTTRDVKLSIIALFAVVRQVKPEIHSEDASKSHQSLKLTKEEILAFQILAVQTHCAQQTETLQSANASVDTLVKHQTVDQNVSSMRIAQVTKHA
jgi:hypothetical protein